jgi:hypothetical protein
MLRRIISGMDLYKGIILASLVLTPGFGIWAWTLRNEIDRGHLAIHNARKRDGDLTTIGLYERQVENQREINRKMGDQGVNPLEYFVTQILRSVNGLRRDDFRLGNIQQQQRPREGTVDSMIDVEFQLGGKEKVLPREAIWAVMLNLEQTLRTWKLRELRIRNRDVLETTRTAKAPPPETGDDWVIERMQFAVREPLKK